jgi:hypothetical protein
MKFIVTNKNMCYYTSKWSFKKKIQYQEVVITEKEIKTKLFKLMESSSVDYTLYYFLETII